MKNKILSNTYAQLSLAVAAVGGLISDEIGQGYWVALLLAGLLFLYAIYDEKKNLKIYTQNNLPIPLVFNVSNPADSKSALSILFTLLEKEFPEHQANLRKHFNIIENDLIFKYDGDIFNEKRFVDFLKISKHNIKKLEAQTPKNVDFHVVYIGPISSAIMVGTLFGTEGVTLYQYNKSSNSYNTVLEIDSREYKESVTTFKVIEKETIGTITDTVTVAIDMASHKVALSELEGAIVHVKSKLGATIHKPEDFIRANQEIYSVINNLQQNVSKIRLVYSMPVTLGILLGMSIQNYWDIEITQYDHGDYKSVIEHLNSIKYYF